MKSMTNVAQWLEHWLDKSDVDGSNPSASHALIFFCFIEGEMK